MLLLKPVEESFLASPNFLWLGSSLRLPLAYRYFCSSVFLGFSALCFPSVCVYLHVQIPYFFKDTSHIDYGPPQKPYFSLVTSVKTLFPN